jgi:hypothetical protein
MRSVALDVHQSFCEVAICEGGEVRSDAPVSKFTLELRGSKKSLLVASRNLCAGKPDRATVRMDAQNGRERDIRPVVRSGCEGKGKAKGRWFFAAESRTEQPQRVADRSRRSQIARRRRPDPAGRSAD